MNKNINLKKYEFINNDVSFIAIGDNSNQIKLIVIGVHIPFDNNSSYRLATYGSNLKIIESIMDEFVGITILAVADFNKDFSAGKRYSKLLLKFINENNLYISEYVQEW